MVVQCVSFLDALAICILILSLVRLTSTTPFLAMTMGEVRIDKKIK